MENRTESSTGDPGGIIDLFSSDQYPLASSRPEEFFAIGSQALETAAEIVTLATKIIRAEVAIDAERLTAAYMATTTDNADPSVHGILVQHPLPKHMDEPAVLALLDPAKDVDGIAPISLGRLVAGMDSFHSCTPAGMIELMKRYGLPIAGKHAVVVGRSVILGKPLALLLLAENATVTVCHSRTPNLAEITRQADILCACVGKAEMITADMIKPGAVILDAGYNRVAGRGGDVGDVEFAGASRVASAITPVPGGVGPMTIAMLLRNTLTAASTPRAAEGGPAGGA